MVECDLAKVEVAGSNPVSRSRIVSHLLPCRWDFVLKRTQGRGTQVVRERSAKPLCVGSIPTRASNLPRDFVHARQFCAPMLVAVAIVHPLVMLTDRLTPYPLDR